MSNEDATLWLTFNGEIYNYLELRGELEAKGHRFKTHSDSEVLLHGYEEWGVHLLSRIKGMFAFGIYDEWTERLFLARDRFGIKPLYYYRDDERFIFASEVKGIVENPAVRRQVDFTSLSESLVYRYVPSPRTIERIFISCRSRTISCWIVTVP